MKLTARSADEVFEYESGDDLSLIGDLLAGDAPPRFFHPVARAHDDAIDDRGCTQAEMNGQRILRKIRSRAADGVELVLVTRFESGRGRPTRCWSLLVRQVPLTVDTL